jgi:ADP-ribose pyrophosphatase YjhB (NUDIX family)
MKYQPIQVTVDIVVFTVHEQTLQVLLIERGIDPFKGRYALPGGFVRAEETLEQAAFRELLEETGTKDVYLEQLYTFGDPHRDPRGRVVTVAYYALVPTDKSPLLAGTDAAAAGWYPVSALPPLAFDHKRIVEYAVDQCRLSVAASKVHAERAASAPRSDPGKTTRQEKLPAEGFGARPRQAFERDASYGAQTRPTLLLPTHNMSRPNTGIVPSRAIPAMDGWRSTAARPNGRCMPPWGSPKSGHRGSPQNRP